MKNSRYPTPDLIDYIFSAVAETVEEENAKLRAECDRLRARIAELTAAPVEVTPWDEESFGPLESEFFPPANGTWDGNLNALRAAGC